MRLAPLLLAPSLAFGQSFEERLIATLPEGASLGGPWQDENENERFRSYQQIVWADDGSQVAYGAHIDGELRPVIGSEVFERRSTIWTPTFSGDVAMFIVTDEVSGESTQYSMLVDGEEIARFRWTGRPSFSPDGEKIAVLARDDQVVSQAGRSSVALFLAERGKDGWSIEQTEGAYGMGGYYGAPVWSRDSKMACTALRDGLVTRVGGWDGRRWKWMETLPSFTYGLAISPKLDKAAVVESRHDGDSSTDYRQVRLGKKVFGADFDVADGPVFGPKGKRLAMRKHAGESMDYAIEDGRTYTMYDHVHGVVFDPKVKNFAYVATVGGEKRTRQTHPGEPGRVGGTAFLVVRPVRGKDRVESPDHFDCIRDVTYSPDGKRIAYCAKDGDKWHLVVDDKQSEAYDEIGAPRFSEDGDRVAFGARKGRELWWKVLEL